MYFQGYLKVAAASPKARLGDPLYNVKAMVEILKEAEKRGAAIICFPELCITGYSVGDMLFQKYLYQDSLKAIQYLLNNNPFSGVIIFGSYLTINDTLYNCSFVVQKKKVLGIIPKTFLPHTNEFYESRWFSSGVNLIKDLKTVRFLGQEVPFGKMLFENETREVIFGAEICGDIWAPTSPNEKLYANGALIVFNSSASPAHIGKDEKRHLLTRSTTMKFNSSYVYVSNNASESTSEVVFSSHLLISEDGKIIGESDNINFENNCIYADIDIRKLHFLRRSNSYFKQTQELVRDAAFQRVRFELEESAEYVFEKLPEKLPFVPKDRKDLERITEIQSASVLKRLDYVGTEKTVLGISGGLDSTLALLSLCKAYDKAGFDRKNIIAVSLPSKETGERTRGNAKLLAEKLGCAYREISIASEAEKQLDLIGHDRYEKDATYENVQARLRTTILMNLANKEKALMIGTTDMSEIALGWSTFGGDQIAMYGLNAGLPKTVVREVVKYYREVYPETKEVLEDILNTPISPELTGSAQRTEDVLGKYEVNDFILYRFLAAGDDFQRIAYLLGKVFGLSDKEAENYVKNFTARFFSQQFKRLSMPESVKILEISLSPRGELKMGGDFYPPQT